MAFRDFNGITYPVPGVDTAIQVLRPGARWAMNNWEFVGWEDDEGREPPTWDELQEEIVRQTKIYDYYSYERNRAEQYPDVKDQLDMIYHDLKNDNLENGTWVASIEKIKEDNPKPSVPLPE